MKEIDTSMDERKKSLYERYFKRFIDLIISVLTLAFFFWLISLITLLICLDMGKPILFKQKRPGLRGKPFNLYKFRTMVEAFDENGRLLPDSKRLTKLGRILRSASLDELPTLINVLKGDMSIVGPRPLLIEYLDRYTPEQARRHEVKPGITGWAQVNGRNAITWEEKFKYDVWYVDNLSLWLDIKIIFMTILKVIKGEGINQPGQATMEEFMGSTYQIQENFHKEKH